MGVNRVLRNMIQVINGFIEKTLLYCDVVREIWMIYSFWKWKWYLKGKPFPPPHLLKAKIVKEYAKQFNLHILIETGTYLGDMVNAAKNIFNEVYSIELDDWLIDRAKKRFSGFPQIHILHGDSAKVLPDLLSSISRPCLFYLDAHYSGSITAKGDLVTPIMKELQCIFNHRISDHVILVDDARFFNGQNDYPTIDELKEFVSKHSRDWVVETENDIIRIHKPRMVRGHGT